MGGCWWNFRPSKPTYSMYKERSIRCAQFIFQFQLWEHLREFHLGAIHKPRSHFFQNLTPTPSGRRTWFTDKPPLNLRAFCYQNLDSICMIFYYFHWIFQQKCNIFACFARKNVYVVFWAPLLLLLVNKRCFLANPSLPTNWLRGLWMAPYFEKFFPVRCI